MKKKRIYAQYKIGYAIKNLHKCNKMTLVNENVYKMLLLCIMSNLKRNGLFKIIKCLMINYLLKNSNLIQILINTFECDIVMLIKFEFTKSLKY